MFEFIVPTPLASVDASLALAATRVGALGVVNLELATDHPGALARLREFSALARGPWGVQLDDEDLLRALLAALPDGLDTVMLPGLPDGRVGELIELVHAHGVRGLAVATRIEQARAAQAAGADGVIAKGHECGGWIGEEGAFVLLQRVLADVELPVFVQGGIGLHTVAGAAIAGAAGAVLDAQLLLARESLPSEFARAALESFDGSETIVLGAALGAPVRVYSRPGLGAVERLREREREPGDVRDWRAAVKSALADPSPDAVLALGQDAAFAADLARRFTTVAGILDGLSAAVADARAAARSAPNPLAEGAPLARSHGTRYPIVQGPMTRVSDRAEFAVAVARAGALPFLALALMRAGEVDALLERAAELHGDRPWGVGILGFVPPELRDEQLEVVRRHRPPFALIAGGRPAQARELEAEGITSYLHVPSPGLLRLYLAEGARRFVFEGRECGGHVGPRTSFVLWDTMLRVLLDELPSPASECHVLFAGGIHDARSAAIVAASAGAASARGIKIGVLLGTAYLFTEEATQTGAITNRFQEAAIAAQHTALLESGPGHATRCLSSPFVAQFEAEKRRLRATRATSEEIRGALEQLNIGRLRIAAKGVDRNPAHASDPAAQRLVELDEAAQWEQGMYMIGQVTALRGELTTLAALHDDVSRASGEVLRAGAQDARLESPVQAPPPPADVAIIGVGVHPPRRGRRIDVLGEHPRQSRRDRRGAGRAVGLAADV